MNKYLKLYDSHSQYVEPKVGPAVSYCIYENEVHYTLKKEELKFVYDNTINALTQGGFVTNAYGTNRGLILRYAENGGQDFDDYFVDGKLTNATYGISENEWRLKNAAPFRLGRDSLINVSMTQSGNDTFYYSVQIYAINSQGNYTNVYISNWESSSKSFNVKELAPGYDVYYTLIVMAKNGRGTSSDAMMTVDEMQEHCTVSFENSQEILDYNNYTISPLLYSYDNLLTSTLSNVVADGYNQTWAGGLLVTTYEIIQGYNYGYLFIMSKIKDSSNPYDALLYSVSLESKSSTNHINNLCLISDDYTNNSVVVMASECNGSKRGFIESINPEQRTSTLLKTLSYSGTKFNTSWNWDWVYDKYTEKLYAVGYSGTKYVDVSDSNAKIEVLEFTMPSSNGITEFTDSDIINQYTFSGVGRERQDIDIVNGVMYFLYADKSVNSTIKTTGTIVDGKVVVCDLATETELATIDLTSIPLEPEGCCLFNGELYVSFHEYAHNNGDLSIYKVTFGT